VQRRFADFSGKPYSAPNVRVFAGEARGFVAARDERYDLIQVALLDSFSEAPRVFRRLFCLSHAPMADPASFE
jgi:hypothetical protein